ncbi:MAG: hypothetical protein JSW61_03995 [Candidatus Thorarchaeota archaeon]|nr:MAG: hypothetical protein JSW61_03995 [Candidatus Thorarchaeota archaeon]
MSKQTQECFVTGIVSTMILATGGLMVSPLLSAAVLVTVPSLTVIWIYQSQKRRQRRYTEASLDLQQTMAKVSTPASMDEHLSSLSKSDSNLILQNTPVAHFTDTRGQLIPSCQRATMQWLQENVPRLPHDLTHCFVENDAITTLKRRILPAARKQIVVVHPSIVQDEVGELLWNASLDGVEVVIVTCKLENAGTERSKGTLFHEELAKAGVDITYRGGIKSDVLIVDVSVAVISTSESIETHETDTIWQPGLVTFEQHVVDNVLSSALRLVN